jgi:hypothetical protein
MDDDEEQMDLFPEDKAHARRSDPHTSHDAADSVEHIRRSQQDVLMVLRRFGPMHDDKLWRVITSLFGKGVLPMSESGCRTRRSELVAKGLVEDTGRRTILPSGRASIVWGAVDAD